MSFYLFIVFPYLDNLQVMIIRGKDKGETGLIKRVIRSQNRVIVEGKNLVRGLTCSLSLFLYQLLDVMVSFSLLWELLWQ